MCGSPSSYVDTSIAASSAEYGSGPGPYSAEEVPEDVLVLLLIPVTYRREGLVTKSQSRGILPALIIAA